MSDTEKLKSKTLSGFLWQFAQKFMGQGLSFVVTVILARLLSPDDYGVVALAGMFNVLMGIFITGSLDYALVQKRDTDNLDYCTVFFASLGISTIIYTIVFFAAPLMARLYHQEMLTPIMRVQALTMPIASFSMVQNARVTREMQFKRFFKASLIGHILSATVGVSMAYNGFGPWALVSQSLTSTIANTLTLFYMVRWIPRIQFSVDRFRVLFDYAWKRTAAGFMGTFCNQLKGYLIGYRYSTADLAFFNRGEGLPDMVKNNLVGTIDGVLFPTLTKVQDDPVALKRGMYRSITTSNFILTPILFGLAATAAQIVPIIYSAKWCPAVPFMQISCITLCIIVINNTNLQVLYATGHTGTVLKQEFIKKPVMIGILAIAIWISPLAICIGILIHSCHELFWTTLAVKKICKYSLREQLRDVSPGFLLAGTMAIIVYGIGQFFTNPYVALWIQIPTGVIFYIGLSHMFKLESYLYARDIILHKLLKK